MNIETLIDDKIMFVRNFGNANVNQVNQLAMNVIQKAKESQSYKILIDHTEMSFVASVINIYEYVKEMSSSERRSAKIAILVSEKNDIKENYSFYEKALSDNGFYVRVFTRQEDALFWLASFA